jgi:hypothetical protein
MIDTFEHILYQNRTYSVLLLKNVKEIEMHIEKISDFRKDTDTKTDDKEEKDIFRQMCERLHLDSSRGPLPPLPDNQRPRAMLARNNEKVLFTNIRIVETGNKGKSIFADENIKKGDSIFSFIGVTVPSEEGSYKSLQINKDLCLESTEGFDNNLNHSCAPNCFIDFEQNPKQPVLVALRDIKKGEELSFDYNTTDYDLNDPRAMYSFLCHCQAPDCVGEIRGYKSLMPEQKRKISPFLAPFLREIYEEEIREYDAGSQSKGRGAQLDNDSGR